MGAPDLQQRRRDLAQIHIAIKQLGMSEDDHRALLKSVCKVDSAAVLDARGRGRYLAHLKRIGFKPRFKKYDPPQATAQLAKIRALWLVLHGRGVVHDSGLDAMSTYIHRQTGVAHPKWLSVQSAQQVIESLKAWQKRAAR